MSAISCIDDLEQIALGKLEQNALGYYRSGADGEQTLHDNRNAFLRYRLRCRVLVDLTRVDLTQTVLGHRVSMPVGVSPTALQKMAHPDGECATARAAQKMGTVFILSSLSTCSIEEVAAAAPNGIKWFQLYVLKDRDITTDLVRRAEQSGYSALVVTVDAQRFGKRLADVRNGFKRPANLSLANYIKYADGDDRAYIHTSGSSPTAAGTSEATELVRRLLDSSLTWSDVRWLRTITRLPLVLKGLMDLEDALKAAQLGVEAIMISNHGARQLDGCLASVDALRNIAPAVRQRCQILMDGGVRRGTDVLKALALGASGVFLGRPLLWGLTHDGEAGATLALQIIRDELRLAMGFCGCTKIEDINSTILTSTGTTDSRL